MRKNHKRNHGRAWPRSTSHFMRTVLAGLAMVSYASLSLAGPDTGGYVAHANVSTYICRTESQARMQDINPDYLVPGCALYAGTAGDQKTTAKKPVREKRRMED